MLVIGEFFWKYIALFILLLLFSVFALVGYNAEKRRIERQDKEANETIKPTDPFEHIKGSLANKSLSSIVSDNQNKSSNDTLNASTNTNIDKL